MIFKCLVSGNTVEFTEEVDIKSMLKHPQYEVVEEVVVKEVPKKKTTKEVNP